MDSQKTIFFYLISLQNVDYYLITNKGEEAAGVDKGDELIGALAEHIKKSIDEGKENEIAEKTKALAELVSARASLLH